MSILSLSQAFLSKLTVAAADAAKDLDAPTSSEETSVPHPTAVLPLASMAAATMESSKSHQYNSSSSILCNSCALEIADKGHYRTDFHRFNLKRRLKDLLPLSEEAFEDLEELSSIEGSDGGEDEDVEEKGMGMEGGPPQQQQQQQGSPFAHFEINAEIDDEFTNSIIDNYDASKKYELLVFKQLLTYKSREKVDYFSLLEAAQLHQKTPVLWTLILLSSGHFSAAIVDASTGKPLLHKTFHRYTTRRKQGGAQSSNDKSKGKATSAGATIRRYNEQALQEEIAVLLSSWKAQIHSSSLIFVRTPVPLRNHIFFDQNLLDQSDLRVRSFSFITKRPTLSELNRCFHELIRIRVQEVQPHDAIVTKPKTTNIVVSETIKKALDALKRGKLDDFSLTLQGIDDINAKLPFENGMTLLHVAAGSPNPQIIDLLLERGADPTSIVSQISHYPYDLAASKESRDVFRRYMARHPTQWDYLSSSIPGPLTPEMEQRAKARETERKNQAKEKKKAAKKDNALSLDDLDAATEDITNQVSATSIVSKTLKESIGLSPEQRMRLDREKRAMAAEARLRSSQAKCGNCNKDLTNLESFDKSIYRYCSLTCLKAQQIIF